MTSSGNRCAGVTLSLAVAAVLLTACQGGPTSGASTTTTAAAPASPRTDVTATPGTTAMDGRTLESPGSQACASPTLEAIRQKLGDVAAQVQTGTASATENQGMKETTCTFSLVPVPQGQDADPGNALTVSTDVFPDADSLAKVGLPRLMMSPNPVDGAGERAWYARNQLSSSTEYVLESVSKNVVTRITLALPVQAAPMDQPQDKLSALLESR
ncbi:MULTISPECIES: hypothetical protein [Arthrobacter]|uniref:DUF3558 domain-containing protein n=1 Tax=Arthrobacter terricola TaxID=2547396 RepID=A0A4R5KHK0_9MICC|nr:MULTISPECIES: hypothetical protein [Arthrobacter]MBT8161843.1 hypothetical protein [Arthrobacter sp. GN70]TDF94228.1 hypothetical protein E1809_14125 [Arthrobacter terricola]